MAKTPKTPDENGADTEDRTELLTTKIIPEVIAGCSYDMDNGAIFGRVHSRIRDWGATSAEISAVGEDIQEQVNKHTEAREIARQKREEKMNIQTSAALNS